MNGGTCVESGGLSSTVGSNTCTIKTQFGEAPNGTSTGNKTASFDVGYTPYSGGNTVNTSSVTLSGNVTAAPSATFSATISESSFNSGNGTVGIPFIGYVNESNTLNITYTNTSNIDATTFSTAVIFPLTSGWLLTIHGCNNTPMPAGNTCTDVYTLNAAIPNNYNVNLGNVYTIWTDSGGTRNQPTSTWGLNTVYATLTVIPQANIVGSIESSTGFSGGNGSVSDSFTVDEGATPAPMIIYRLTNSNATSAASNFYIDGAPGNGWTIYANNCGSSANPTTLVINNGYCDIWFQLDTTGTGTYNLDMSAFTIYWTNQGNPQTQSKVLSGTIYAQVNSVTPLGKKIFVDMGSDGTGYTGNLGGISGADAKCQASATTNGYSGIFKAMIADGINRYACSEVSLVNGCGGIYAKDWVLAANTQYVRADGTTTIATTTATQIFAFPLTNSIDPNSKNAWTGMYTNWYPTYDPANQMTECSGWTADSDENSTYGQSNYVTNYSLTRQWAACSSKEGLYCVQQ